MLDQNKKILITGGRSGFGHQLARYLDDAGYRNIHFILNPYLLHPPMISNEHIQIHKGELLDQPFLEDLICRDTIIIHTSLILNAQKKYLSYTQTHNVEGTSQLVNIALSSGVPIIYIGSALSTTKSDKHTPILIKILKRVDMEIQRGLAEGLSTRIYRPGAILNPTFDTFRLNNSALRLPAVDFIELAGAITEESNITQRFISADQITNQGGTLLQAYHTEARNIQKSFLPNLILDYLPDNPNKFLFEIDFQSDTYT